MPEQKTIKFHYTKSPSFRVMHVDGMIGGPTPSGNVHIAFYSERPAIPQSSEHEIQEDGSLGDPVERGKEGFVRELDCDLVMDRFVAQALKKWLTETIEELDDLLGEEASVASDHAP